MPYTSPYASKWQGRSLGGPEVQDPRGRSGAEGSARLMQMLGQWAPLAGTAVGGIAGGIIGAGAGGVGAIPGAVSGAGLGNAAGQALGAGLGFAGDETMKPYDEAEARRRARQQAIAETLAQLRATQ